MREKIRQELGAGLPWESNCWPPWPQAGHVWNAAHGLGWGGSIGGLDCSPRSLESGNKPRDSNRLLRPGLTHIPTPAELLLSNPARVQRQSPPFSAQGQGTPDPKGRTQQGHPACFGPHPVLRELFSQRDFLMSVLNLVCPT